MSEQLKKSSMNIFHEKRVQESESEKKKTQQPEVKEVWYELVTGTTFDPRKGKKLVKKELTKTGVNSSMVGWEKKLGSAFMKKLEKDNLIRK